MAASPYFIIQFDISKEIPEDLYDKFRLKILKDAPEHIRKDISFDPGADVDEALSVIQDFGSGLNADASVVPYYDGTQSLQLYCPDTSYLLAMLMCVEDRVPGSITFDAFGNIDLDFCEETMRIARNALPDLPKPEWLFGVLADETWRNAVPDHLDFKA